MTLIEINQLEKLLAKMKRGPYEYWNEKDNDFLVAECKKSGKGKLIASLPGVTSMPAEFTAIAALLNAAPELISAAKKSIKTT